MKPEHAYRALKKLIKSLGPRTGRDDTIPDVFVLFDEAHALTELKTHSNRTYFIELRSVLHDLGDFSLFAFFLSTTSKISQFAMPKDIDQSHRVGQDPFGTSLLFTGGVQSMTAVISETLEASTPWLSRSYFAQTATLIVYNFQLISSALFCRSAWPSTSTVQHMLPAARPVITI